MLILDQFCVVGLTYLHCEPQKEMETSRNQVVWGVAVCFSPKLKQMQVLSDMKLHPSLHNMYIISYN